MKLPAFSSLRKMIQRLAKSEEQGKKDVCYREPSVLVTLYVVKHRGSHNTPARKLRVRRRPRHRQEIRVQSAVSDGGGGGYNRREELLRYSRQLRMQAVADQPPPLHLPNEPQRHGQGKRLLEKMFTSLKKTKNVR